MCFGKCLVRAAVITALAGGAAVVIAGPHRVRAVLHQARQHVNQVIDQRVDDPIALREQIRSLKAEYPQRIAAVQNDLTELEAEIEKLEWNQAVATRTAALLDQDLAQINGLIGQAETAVASARDNGQFRVVRLQLDDHQTVDIDTAYSRASNLQRMRDSYVSRATEVNRGLELLGQQHERLENLHAQLVQEQADFETQLFQLDTQIDAIARNDRLIEMLETRQARIDDASRYEAHSLDQLTGRVEQILTQQNSRLNQIVGSVDEQRYEQRAIYELERGDDAAPADAAPASINVAPQASLPAIQISPDVVVIGQPATAQKSTPGQN